MIVIKLKKIEIKRILVLCTLYISAYTIGHHHQVEYNISTNTTYVCPKIGIYFETININNLCQLQIIQDTSTLLKEM